MGHTDTPAPEHIRLPLGKKVLFAAILLLVPLAGAEIISRLTIPSQVALLYERQMMGFDTAGLPALRDIMRPSPRLFWSLKPNLSAVPVEGKNADFDLSFSVSTNELGLQNGPIGPKGDAYRILLVGDSCTFGLGVEDDQSFPARLQQLLDESPPDGRRVEITNAGVPGYTSYQGLRYLLDHGFSLSPDCVMICFGVNDAAGWNGRSDMENAKSFAATRIEAVLLKSRLYAGLKSWLANSSVSTEPPPRDRDKPRRPRLTEEEFSTVLEEISKESRRRNIRLAYIIWPYRHQVSSLNEDPIWLQEVISTVAKNEGHPCISLTSLFINSPVRPLYLDHVHATRFGLNIVANRLAATIHGMITGWAVPPPNHLEQVRQLVRLDPQDAQAKIVLGNALANRRQNEKAIEVLKEIPALEPKRAQIWRSLGNTFGRLGQYEDAAAAYEHAIELAPDDSLSLSRLATERYRFEKYEEAIELYARALQADPRLISARRNLADLYADLGRYQDAVNLLRQGLADDPHERLLIVPLAWYLATARDDSVRNGADARKLIGQNIRERRDGYYPAYRALAAAYAEEGKFPMAIKAAQAARKMAETSNDQAYVEEIQEHLQLYEQKKPVRLTPI